MRSISLAERTFRNLGLTMARQWTEALEARRGLFVISGPLGSGQRNTAATSFAHAIRCADVAEVVVENGCASYDMPDRPGARALYTTIHDPANVPAAIAACEEGGMAVVTAWSPASLDAAYQVMVHKGIPTDFIGRHMAGIVAQDFGTVGGLYGRWCKMQVYSDPGERTALGVRIGRMMERLDPDHEFYDRPIPPLPEVPSVSVEPSHQTSGERT